MENLINETLETCREYIPKLIKAVTDAAYDIQSGNEAKGIRLMPGIFDGLQWVIDAVMGVQQNGFPLGIDIKDITEIFKELEKALEVRDHVLIADLFEYEIGPSLEKWLKIIEQSRGEISDDGMDVM